MKAERRQAHGRRLRLPRHARPSVHRNQSRRPDQPMDSHLLMRRGERSMWQNRKRRGAAVPPGAAGRRGVRGVRQAARARCPEIRRMAA
ncbi:conserved hypothetical protein [Burkholderia pseudomallei Pakistan 9]|nr:conserved hypothetical protein [Burkholderia pseudomallei Pakistan 9]